MRNGRTVTRNVTARVTGRDGAASFYKSSLWLRLRAAVIRRSRGICEVPGCGVPGKVVDHVIARGAGGPDALGNLRHLCREHDNQVMQRADGKRRSGGALTVKGCYPDGSPRDPNHPWHTGEK